MARELWLEAGDYTLTTEDREPAVRVDFAVGRVEGGALRVALR